jgi:hypothetical protein
MIRGMSFKRKLFLVASAPALWALLPALFPALRAAASGEVELLTEDLPWAVVDRAYSPAPLDVRVTGRCPAGGVGFAVVSGVLPAGLKLSRLGYFSGVPTQTGLFEFNVRAVNGCSWAGRVFSLLVTNPPKLKATPEQLSVASTPGSDPHGATIHLTASWPRLAYLVSVAYAEGGSNWLMAIPEHGATSRESVPRQLSEVPSDEIELRFNATGLKPGRYTARVSMVAWQAIPVSVTVILTVAENLSQPEN